MSLPGFPPNEGLEKVKTLGKVLESTVVPREGVFLLSAVVVRPITGFVSVVAAVVVAAAAAGAGAVLVVVVDDGVDVREKPPVERVGKPVLAGVDVESAAAVVVVVVVVVPITAGLLSSVVVAGFGSNAAANEDGAAVVVVVVVAAPPLPGRDRLNPLGLGFSPPPRRFNPPPIDGVAPSVGLVSVVVVVVVVGLNRPPSPPLAAVVVAAPNEIDGVADCGVAAVVVIVGTVVVVVAPVVVPKLNGLAVVVVVGC